MQIQTSFFPLPFTGTPHFSIYIEPRVDLRCVVCQRNAMMTCQLHQKNKLIDIMQIIWQLVDFLVFSKLLIDEYKINVRLR